VQHRFEWRYLVGFVHPATGRTVFHLATTVSIALFEAELEACARQVGASITKQIVLVQGGAGWHSSVKLRVPDRLHVLFLPAYSPQLQPAEHLWPLTNTALANRHFASVDKLEEAQFARCRALQGGPISSAGRPASTGGPAASRNDRVPGECRRTVCADADDTAGSLSA
jgi:hypothetical protein